MIRLLGVWLRSAAPEPRTRPVEVAARTLARATRRATIEKSEPNPTHNLPDGVYDKDGCREGGCIPSRCLFVSGSESQHRAGIEERPKGEKENHDV